MLDMQEALTSDPARFSLVSTAQAEVLVAVLSLKDT